MAFFALRRSNAHPAQHRRRLGEIGAVIALCAFVAAGAQAQTVIGGNSPPSVTVDTSVLDQLGPAPTLPQSFHGEKGAAPAHGAAHGTAPHPRAVSSSTAHRHKPSTHKHGAPAHRTSASRSSLHSVVHLTPPGTRVASAAKAHAPTRKTTTAGSHDSTGAKLAALASPVPSPAPLPKLPQPGSIPAAPQVPPTPAHVEEPVKPNAPPAQTAITSPVEAAPVGATAPAPRPSPAPQPAPTQLAPAAPVTAPPPAAATSTASTAPAVQMAAATTAGAVGKALTFAPGATDLPPGPQASLDAIAQRMLADNRLRVQVIAHATGSADAAMEARRVSLARAVAVRAYLIQKGVHSLRIDVRALGNRAEDGPVSDQVDLVLLNQ